MDTRNFKGVVQLSSFVRSQADIDRAVQVARGITGAKSVKRDDPLLNESMEGQSGGGRGSTPKSPRRYDERS
jgi:hypothetical protein